MDQYSAEYSVRFGLDVPLFGFGRIVKSAFRYITSHQVYIGTKFGACSLNDSEVVAFVNF